MSEIVLKYPHGAPAWVDLLTTDPSRSTQFYGALFGWKFFVPNEDAGFTMCLVDRRLVCSIGDAATAPAGKLGWTMYLAVDDVDATAVEVRKHGGTVSRGPVDVQTAGRMAMVVDPGEAVVGLWQARDQHGAQIANEPNTFAYGELTCPNAEQARRFYLDVLGWQIAAVGEGAHAVVEVAGRAVAAIRNAPQAGTPVDASGWMVCFRVPDTDAAAATASTLGADVVTGHRTTALGHVAVLRDPMGALFAVTAS